MIVGIGIRQVPHFRRRPSDVLRLPLFVLQLTFVMVPIRLLAFATMLHQSWTSLKGLNRLMDLPVERPRRAAR